MKVYILRAAFHPLEAPDGFRLSRCCCSRARTFSHGRAFGSNGAETWAYSDKECEQQGLRAREARLERPKVESSLQKETRRFDQVELLSRLADDLQAMVHKRKSEHDFPFFGRSSMSHHSQAQTEILAVHAYQAFQRFDEILLAGHDAVDGANRPKHFTKNGRCSEPSFPAVLQGLECAAF